MLLNDNLITFFNNNRPQKEDIAVIIMSVLRVLLENKKVICLSMDNIFYNVAEKKVTVTENKKNRNISDDEISLFVKMICKECRYAGDDVYEFTYDIYRLICEKKYVQCMKELEVYMSVKRKQKKCGYIIWIRSVLIIAVFEILFIIFN